ncbi:F-box domain protein [Pandoravirus inopinatum]|uniref:F-box domain protein n=1 Tax=Pandoravirus inopinatum TaxID=1605721 RepID=A0A0B5J8L8_9VIRU|nr:F-box domain protein [Pandoravirus inopinatum]AJF97131.1 F-box domain protein [Pandoravirus inopinatum]
MDARRGRKRMDTDALCRRTRPRREPPTDVYVDTPACALTLADLPDEILFHIASCLPLGAVAALGCASHQMRAVCLDDSLWRRFYERDFPPCNEIATTKGACLTLGNG